MRVTIVLEQRFQRTPDGGVWTASNFDGGFWNRYLDVFDRINVVARVEQVDVVPDNWRVVNTDRVTVTELPYYLGPLQYLAKRRAIEAVVRKLVNEKDAFILRVPSPVASLLAIKLMQSNRPYAVEVVGDPNDVFAPGSVTHPLRPFFRYWFARSLRKTCLNAAASAYVTEHKLQQRYAPNPAGYSTHYSSIELRPEAFVDKSRRQVQLKTPVACVMVGTLAQLYKAPDVLLSAMKSCIDHGIDVRLNIVGDGRYRRELEQLSHRLDIADRVVFLGHLLAGQAVREELDQADLFVLPSRQEGLPRAMIEAMARGLPCIGSTVGGIPELLPPEDMVPPGDPVALATKIREVVSDPDRIGRMSARNLEKAKEYRSDLLRERRIAFYRSVRDQTEAWLRSEKRR
jgi:glycosyltransferase involved in cell wall biosynthesis